MAGSGSILLRTDKGVEDITPFVSGFTYRNSLLRGCTRWRLSFETPQWDFWKTLMIGSGLVFQVQVAGLRDGRTETSPWMSLVVDLSDGDLDSVRLRGMIEGGGPELGMMNQDNRRAFVNTTAGQVLRRIAAEYSLAAKIPPSTEISSWYQINETDWDFVNDVLEDYIPAQNARGDAFLNVSEGALNVVTINYAAPSVRKYDLTDGDDRVPKVRFRYYGGQVARSGVVVEARGFNRATGTAASYKADPQTAPGTALADRLPQSLASKKKVVLSASGEVETLRALAIREQAKFARRYFGIEVKALNDLSIRLGDMIEVSAKDEKGEMVFTAGRYGVFEYYLVYSLQAVYSKIIGYRQESYAGPVPATGAPASASSGIDRYRQGRTNVQPVVKTAVPTG